MTSVSWATTENPGRPTLRKDPMKKIYHFPVNEAFEETGEALPVTIDANGSADLSALPDKLRDFLTIFGSPDALHRGRLTPEDGEAFLQSLLENATGYWRFRSSL
jgi:hypothetical protein